MAQAWVLSPDDNHQIFQNILEEVQKMVGGGEVLLKHPYAASSRGMVILQFRISLEIIAFDEFVF